MLASMLGGPLTAGQHANAFELLENGPETTAILVLSDEISGRIYIRDWEDMLVVEMNKPCGNDVELGLDEGKYVVINIWEGAVYESTITLQHGDRLKLTPELFITGESVDMPEERIQSQPHKETLMGDRIETRITGGFDIKSTRIFDDHSVFIGGNIGLTLNRNIYIGAACYSRAIRENGFFDLELDVDAGLPSYGGLVLGYSFFPSRKVHFRVETLLGAGDAWQGFFTIVEPRIDMVLNISQILRLRFGLAMPFTSQEKIGLENVMMNFGIQFGK